MIGTDLIGYTGRIARRHILVRHRGEPSHIAFTLLHELQRRDARKGVAALCIGVGQGIAVVLENVAAR